MHIICIYCFSIHTWKLVQEKFNEECVLLENEASPKRFQLRKKYFQNFGGEEKTQFISDEGNRGKKMCKPTKCEDCGKMVKYLKSHREKVHEAPQFQCNHCDYTAASKHALTDHIEARHDRVAKYCCEICGHKTHSKPNLYYHKHSVHRDVKSNCEVCGKELLNNQTRTRHMRLHLAEEDKVYHYCDKCEYKTRQTSALKEHIRSQHEGLKQKCHLCEAEFTYDGALNRHIKTVHEGRRYICPVCQHVTTQRVHLRAHMRRHKDVLGEDTDSVANATQETKIIQPQQS